jgi:formylmethanofuran dehydrogenase subunit E
MGYRDEIERFVIEDNLEGLLKKSAEFHGHICSYSAYGVKAGYHAMKELSVTSKGMEEVISVVETNNCFSDGIQLVTGCTFGNNALIFKDIGKTAVTVINRKNKRSIRLALKKSFWDSRKKEYPGFFELFEKIVVRRESVPDSERKKFFRLAEEMALNELKVPEEIMFEIERKKVRPPEYAPIFDSVACSICGEAVMESRAGVRKGRPACLTCMEGPYFYMDGYGIGYMDKKKGNKR